MLSVILYGRNDAHGYNLHKRAALSLNCIAEVLTGETDEIIFVDYNTSDELPTFPEAIADTLTDRCKEKLRILRARSSYHAQFVGKTRLVALECQSRNIAIRRSNPANRWVLSTNTDMIFWTKAAEGDLTGAVSGLEDGFYHLPRFEVPEGFWERLDRKQPVAAIEAMRDAGVRFHLNEVVFGSYDNLYEGPGDFQLFLRQDLFDIAGFDERMILGWHADTNIARRMRLLRGEVKTAFDRIYGYHCGHTRQATSLHGGNRTENSLDQFVRNVTDPVAGQQIGTWGAPDADIEEIRLTAQEVYLPAMTAAVQIAGPQHSEAVYNGTNFDKVAYETDHVLPHLCDVLFNLPAGQTIFFFGDDIPLLEGVREFLETASKSPRFVLADLAAAPEVGALDPTRWSGVVRSFAEGVSEASLFLIQYPRGQAEPSDAQRALEWSCQRVLAGIAELERERPAHLRRRIITVNSIHNRFFNLVESTLAPSVMPFSSRLRQGFVVDDHSARSLKGAPEWPIYERLGRTSPFLAEDWDLLDRLIAGFRADQPVKGWERLAPELAALAAAPATLRAARGLTDEEAQIWGEKADTAMRRQLSLLAAIPEAVSARPEVSNRALSGSDWDAPEWARLAQTYFGAGVMAFGERKRWVWERISLAIEIQRRIPAGLNRDNAAEQPNILFLADEPDLLSLILVHLGYRVTFVTSHALLQGVAGPDWRESLDLSWLSLPPNLTPFDPKGVAGGFAGLVATKPSLFEKSSEDVDAILAAVDPLMAPGALLLAASTVQLNENAFLGGFGYAEWKVLYEPEGPMGCRGFSPIGEVDLRIPLDTVVRFALEDDPQDTVYGLSYGLVNTFNTSILLTARWPECLQPGPTERRAWRGGLIDPGIVLIPYGSALTPAVGDKSYDNVGSLAGRAFRAIETIPVPLGPEPRNVLPFVLVDDQAQRTPIRVSLFATEDGGPTLAICLEAGGARRIVIDVEASGGAVLNEASALVHGVGPTAVTLDGGQAALSAEAGFRLVSVALRYAGAEVQLNGVRAWIEP